jgi:4-hydroxybenzoate polyprenyltransferase
MKAIEKRDPIGILKGFFLLSHPGPVLFHAIAVALFALLAGWSHIAWSIFVLVVVAHVVMQLSIAVSNDYCDRERDALSKKNKPIVSGLVRPQEALITAIVLMIVMVLLLLPLNPLALLVSLLYLACGQSYNLGLKSTPFSGIVFAVMFPLIPVYAFVGMGRIIPFIFWQIPIAALLGIVINLANSLPDIEEDAASHAHTLAVVLGATRSFITCNLLILLATCLIALLTVTKLVTAQSWILLPILILVCLAVGVLWLFFGSNKARQTSKIYFYLIVLTCLVLAIGWIISAVM